MRSKKTGDDREPGYLTAKDLFLQTTTHAETNKGALCSFLTPSILLIFHHVFLCSVFSTLAKYVIPHFDQFEKLYKKKNSNECVKTDVEIIYVQLHTCSKQFLFMFIIG